MEEIDLKDFLAYLKKFVIAIVVVALIAVGGTYFYDTKVKTPMYSTYTKILLVKNQEEETSSSATLNDISVNQKLAATYSEFVKSRLVLQQVIDELHLDYTVEKLAKNNPTVKAGIEEARAKKAQKEKEEGPDEQ